MYSTLRHTYLVSIWSYNKNIAKTYFGRLFRSILININQASSELFIFKGVQIDLDNTERIIINIYFKDIPQWVKYARVFWPDTVNNNNVVYTGVGIRNSLILRKTIFNIIKATGDIEGFEIIKNLKKTRFIVDNQDSIQNSVTIIEGTIVDWEITREGNTITNARIKGTRPLFL